MKFKEKCLIENYNDISFSIIPNIFNLNLCKDVQQNEKIMMDQIYSF